MAKRMSEQEKRRPALDPEARELQMVNLAVNLAEQQMLQGTASSAIICHYLKLGTARAELEKEKLKKENKLLDAKAKAIESTEEMKILYEKAIKAMKNYAGYGGDEPDEY